MARQFPNGLEVLGSRPLPGSIRAWQSASRLLSGRTKDEVTKTLVTEYGWAQGGLAVRQVDSMIAELKQ